MKMLTPPASLMVTGEVWVPEAYPGLAFIDGLRQKMRVGGGGVAVVPRRVRISGEQPRAMPEGLDLLGGECLMAFNDQEAIESLAQISYCLFHLHNCEFTVYRQKCLATITSGYYTVCLKTRMITDTRGRAL